MTIANLATDGLTAFRYKAGMANAPRITTTPASPMNQWARDAIIHYGQSMTAVADAMNRAGLKTKYDRSKIQKMTVSRRVTLEEAEALSRITGYPMTDQDEVQKFVDDFRDLDESGKALVWDLVKRLRAGVEGS